MRKLAPHGAGGPTSRWMNIDGPFHYLDYGGLVDGPLLVCLHGLSGSAHTWRPIAPTLTTAGRVLAVDLVGFGRSSCAGRPVTLPANQQYLDRFLRRITAEPAILVGHSMGATIAAMQAALNPKTTAGLVLINPAIPWQLQDQISPFLAAAIGASGFLVAMLPGPGRRERARDMQQLLGDFLRIRYPGLIPAAVKIVTKGVASTRLGDRAADPETRAAFLSLLWTLGRRWQFAATVRSVRAPVLLLHGDRDRMVPTGAVAAIAAANPAWQLHVARSIGHFPPLEVPDWTISHILTWLDEENLRHRTVDHRV